MFHDAKKIWKSAAYALKGFYHAYRADKSFRMEIVYGLPVYLAVGWYLAPFQAWEFVFLVFSYALILIVELINTAFEKMLDRLHPDEHELIGKSKDIASAAVFVAFLFATVVVFVLFCARAGYGPYDSTGWLFV